MLGDGAEDGLTASAQPLLAAATAAATKTFALEPLSPN
jgi:hypothetical protein